MKWIFAGEVFRFDPDGLVVERTNASTFLSLLALLTGAGTYALIWRTQIVPPLTIRGVGLALAATMFVALFAARRDCIAIRRGSGVQWRQRSLLWTRRVDAPLEALEDVDARGSLRMGSEEYTLAHGREVGQDRRRLTVERVWKVTLRLRHPGLPATVLVAESPDERTATGLAEQIRRFFGRGGTATSSGLR